MSEPGFKAQQMKTMINVKTKEKGLRFGPSKCWLIKKLMPTTVIYMWIIENIIWVKSWIRGVWFKGDI